MTVTFEHDSTSQTVIAESAITVQVVEEAVVKVELLRQAPQNSALNIEPNQPIELYFNQAIDATKLAVSVKESLHGKTYINSDTAGANFLDAQGYQLVQVDRDNEPVAGGISVLPGNQSVAFYPNRQFGFNADVFVSVTYDGQELSRTTFKTRRLPTFIAGSLSDQFGQPLAGVSVSVPELKRTTQTNGDGGFGFQEQPGNEIPGGRYQLIINGELNYPGYGNLVRGINVEEGRRNSLDMLRIPELHPELPFLQISGGQAQVNLAGTDLQLDLSGTRLLFNKGRAAGELQVQFMPFEQLFTQLMPGFMPQWMFASQPRGVRAEGAMGISIKIPPLNATYDYLPTGTAYVVILGYDPEREVIGPVGIGKIQNNRVVSQGKLDMKSLDFIGYTLIDPKHQTLLQQVAEGNKSIAQLISALQE